MSSDPHSKPQHPMEKAARGSARGFTLTEIIITVVIIAALAGIAFPIVKRGIQSSQKAGCLSNLRQIGLGLESYLQDNNQIMPELETGRRSLDEDIPVLENTLDVYLESELVFRCPADPEVFEATGSSYIWNSTQSGLRRTQLEFLGTDDPSRIPLVIDKEAWHPGAGTGSNFLYANMTTGNRVSFAVSE